MQDNTTRFLIISSALISGLLIGIILGPTIHSLDIQFIASIGLVLIIAVFIAVYRIFSFKKKKSVSDSNDSTEVGFVVDTFHDLVGQLKEKEKELEILKSNAEEKAVRMEAYNENILQSVPSGVISIDNDMKVRSFNSSAERILGISASEAVENNFAGLLGEPFISVLKKGVTISRNEYPYVTRDKRHIWLGISSSLLQNSQKEKIGLIFVFTDLTDIRALQAQIELKQRLSHLGEMSAGISHELRNSMSVISGYAKLLSRKVQGSSRTTVDAIQKEISIMDNIISQLLSFAKPSVLTREKIDLCELIEEAASSALDGNNGVAVSFKTDKPVPVDADSVLLRQALSNLFLNAAEAMPGGGTLNIHITRNAHRAEITIADTGYGMPGDVAKKIFLPFFTTKEDGVGLGLALVHKIIVSHGGSIGVESKEGKGTTFRVTLPIES
jgi:PAS domain S-box-containing protein